MPFTIDFLGDGVPLAWSLTGTVDDPSWTVTQQADYRPALYAVTQTGMDRTDPAPSACIDELEALQGDLVKHPAVQTTAVEDHHPGFRYAEQPTLRIEVDRMDSLRPVAQFVERRGPPGHVPFRAFDVDLSPGFRFCLDHGVSPCPDRQLRVLHLGLSQRAVADEDLAALEIGADVTVGSTQTPTLEEGGDTPTAVLETLRDRLARTDPDVLLVDHGDIVPLVADAAAEYGIDLGLARVPADMSADSIPAYQQLAGRSTFESYGTRHHSPARYNVPGRVLIDQSNTFFHAETNLAGCLDLIERSGKPLQELSWASIGNVLTAIQIREARKRDVLVQWRAWRPERFKTAHTLHASDRGGTTLSPVVGFHDDVHELDFASLYPNIICEFNLSPETVRCRCHDRADVPELDYSVCDQAGYLPDVLQPIIDARADIKDRLAAADAGELSLAPDERKALEGQSSALKWILVSCFGYQGFSNAKFGRIEVHEAINAYARDILLTAKERLEAGGWRVLHGIVDSLWVTPRPDTQTQTDLQTLAAEITDTAGITLEYEGAFDWVAFCPRRGGGGGALTRYFGRHTGAPDYKVRGLECRQRSTCTWVEYVQRDLITALDDTRDPQAVCDRLAVHCRALCRGDVDPNELVIRTRASKDAEAYTQQTKTVAALERAADRGLETHPGQDIWYVVRDDTIDGPNRVWLATELDDSCEYDSRFYRSRAIRACASVLSPLDWHEEDIEAYLDSHHNTSLTAF